MGQIKVNKPKGKERTRARDTANILWLSATMLMAIRCILMLN